MVNRKLLWRLLLIVVLSVAGFLLYRTLSRYSFGEIVSSLRSIPAFRLVAAFGFAAGSYVCLTGFDALGLRYAGKPLPHRMVALASFVSLSIGHNIGIAALSSGAIRYRFYSRWGLDAGEVAKVILFCGATVALGLITLGGAGLLINPGEAEALTGLRRQTIVVLGVLCLGCTGAYLLLSATVRSSLCFRGWTVEMPSLPLAACQVMVGSLNFALVAACLYQTVATFTDAGYLEVSSVYVIANSTALVAHVPGGLGVLETAIVYLLPGGALVGALIAFRFVYFFVPLALGLLLLTVAERRFRQAAPAGRTKGAGPGSHETA